MTGGPGAASRRLMRIARSRARLRALFRSWGSYFVAAAIAVAVIVWVWSGDQVTGRSQPPSSREASAVKRQRDVDVRVAVLHAQPVRRTIVLGGRTEPARAVTVRAEIDGRVVAVGAERGARVEESEVLVRLDRRALDAELREARALVRQREIEFDASQRLSARSFQTETALAAAEADLEAARAASSRVALRVANTTVRAPFAGRLEQRMVEVGDYLSSGDPVARVLDEDPILVAGHVLQQERHQVGVGGPGEARLITGETVEGRVRYVASESDDATRTFRVELEVPNPGGSLLSGISAELRIPAETTAAHRISPALLALDEQGRLGVKSVGDAGVVEFHPAGIVRAETGAVWVSGLPDPVRVITTGQGFVRPGQRVNAVPAAPPADADEGDSG